MDKSIVIKKEEILNVAKKLAYNYCKRMYASSGLGLYRQLINGGNLTYNLDDMSQDIALAICEYCKEDNTHGYIINESNYRDVYRTVNNRVYQLRRNSTYKSLYIDIDGEEVCITDVLGMCKALDEDTRWYALMLFDSMVNALDDSNIDSRALVNKDKLTVYGYQRIVEGRAIKDCDYNYCDLWLKRHRNLFDI